MINSGFYLLNHASRYLDMVINSSQSYINVEEMDAIKYLGIALASYSWLALTFTAIKATHNSLKVKLEKERTAKIYPFVRPYKKIAHI